VAPNKIPVMLDAVLRSTPHQHKQPTYSSQISIGLPSMPQHAVAAERRDVNVAFTAPEPQQSMSMAASERRDYTAQGDAAPASHPCMPMAAHAIPAEASGAQVAFAMQGAQHGMSMPSTHAVASERRDVNINTAQFLVKPQPQQAAACMGIARTMSSSEGRDMSMAYAQGACFPRTVSTDGRDMNMVYIAHQHQLQQHNALLQCTVSAERADINATAYLAQQQQQQHQAAYLPRAVSSGEVAMAYTAPQHHNAFLPRAVSCDHGHTSIMYAQNAYFSRAHSCDVRDISVAYASQHQRFAHHNFDLQRAASTPIGFERRDAASVMYIAPAQRQPGIVLPGPPARAVSSGNLAYSGTHAQQTQIQTLQQQQQQQLQRTHSQHHVAVSLCLVLFLGRLCAGACLIMSTNSICWKHLFISTFNNLI
jgi:hypothetical protein